MQQTMTWAGLDVHARSTHAAAVIAETGELRRARFGADQDGIVGWLSALPAPVRACYEAGPTGYGLARAARAAGIEMEVIAPGKTPRAAAERVKTDRRDAEHLVRQLMAGSLKPIPVPSEWLEAARDLVRAREDVRCDLTPRAAPRVQAAASPRPCVRAYGSTWTTRHRDWLARQSFDEPAAELAYLDALAAVDGLIARRGELEQHLSAASLSIQIFGRPWPGCALSAASTH